MNDTQAQFHPDEKLARNLIFAEDSAIEAKIRTVDSAKPPNPIEALDAESF